MAASSPVGFLIVDKPGGITSHDVVAKVRRAVGRTVKVGHAGTLDPLATGVLVICLGAAARLAEWATGADKRYRADVVLGVETDSYDADGRVVAEQPVEVDRAALDAALEPLRGTIEQRPPAFSAIQIDGRRLYDLARRGVVVDVPARTVTVHELTVLDFSPPRATIEIFCSKGTYVRSLAHDLGRSLGCGAHLGALRRLASGAFTLEHALPLERALELLRDGEATQALRPLELAVMDLPRLDPGAAGIATLRHGLPWASETAPQPDEGSPILLGRAHDEDGDLVAIVEWREGGWWPRKVLST